MADPLYADGFKFDIELEDRVTTFHVGVVHRPGTVPTSVHFNEMPASSAKPRISFAIHLPPTQWKPAAEGGLKTVCRIAIGQALRDSLFAQPWHDDYDFDPSPRSGMETFCGWNRVKLQPPSA